MISITQEDNDYLTREIINTTNNKRTHLPHGSGIDADYSIEETANTYIVENQYHCMNENGFYDGWIPFQLIIPKNDPQSFKLHFINLNGAGWYRVYKYQLRLYLEDLYAMTLSDLEEDQ
ncbi:MAG: hypothetical protein R6V04_16730 [bacterium]